MSRRKFTFPEVAAAVFDAGDDPDIELAIENFGAIDYDADDAPPAFLADDVYKGMTPRQIAYAQAVFACGGDRKAAMVKAGYVGSNWREVEKNPKVRRAVALAIAGVLKGQMITAESVMLKLNEIANRAATEGQYKAAVDALKTMGEFMGMKTDEGQGNVHIDNHGQMIVIAGAGVKDVEDPAMQQALNEVLAQNRILPMAEPELVVEATEVDG